MAVALCWIILSITGACLSIISGSIPHPIDAIFETVSGFTTTGSSILTDVEVLPKSIIFWRSFTHWIGGMGVLVFLLSLLPLAGGYHMNLMRAESPGPSVSKLVPKVQSTAKILYTIYFGNDCHADHLSAYRQNAAVRRIMHHFRLRGNGRFRYKK